jgi:hypothetical protein
MAISQARKPPVTSAAEAAMHAALFPEINAFHSEVPSRGDEPCEQGLHPVSR